MLISTELKGSKNYLGGIKEIKIKFVLIFFFNQLHTQIPFGVRSNFDCVPKVSSVEIRVLSCNLQRLIPHKRVSTKVWYPMIFNEGAFAFLIDESESMNAKPLHHAVRSRNRPIRREPLLHVKSGLVKRHEVPSIVVSCLGLRNLIVRLGLDGMDDIRKLNRILEA